MKFNQSLFFLITIMVITVYGYKTEYTLDDVKKLKVDTCKSDNDCKKDFQTECLIPKGEKEGHCISTLYCHPGDEKCVYEVDKDDEKEGHIIVNFESIRYSDYFYYFGNQPTLILESCNSKEARLSTCYTRECDKNEQCFSGICEDRNCIADEKKPLYICSNDESVFQGLDLDKFKTDSLTCKLAEEEICKRSSDCASGSCEKINDIEICVTLYNNKLRIALAALLVVLIFIAGLIVFKAYRHNHTKKVKKDLKVKYEMEDAFYDHSRGDYIELEEVEDFAVEASKLNRKL